MTGPTELKELIKTYSRRLNKLKDKKAYKGIDTEPQILMEIEDIEGHLTTLKRELETLDENSEQAGSADSDHLDRYFEKLEQLGSALEDIREVLERLESSKKSVKQNVKVSGKNNQVYTAGRDINL